MNEKTLVYQKIKDLAKELMFDLDNEQIELIINEYHNIEDSLNAIKDLKIDDVEPTSFIQDICYQHLNDDEYIEYDNQQVFQNSKYYKNGMVVINDKK